MSERRHSCCICCLVHRRHCWSDSKMSIKVSSASVDVVGQIADEILVRNSDYAKHLGLAGLQDLGTSTMSSAFTEPSAPMLSRL